MFWIGSTYFYSVECAVNFVKDKEITCICNCTYQCNGFIFSVPNGVGIRYTLLKLIENKVPSELPYINKSYNDIMRGINEGD